MSNRAVDNTFTEATGAYCGLSFEVTSYRACISAQPLQEQILSQAVQTRSCTWTMKSLVVGPLWASKTATVILRHSSLYLCALFFSNLKCAKQCKACSTFRNSRVFMLWTWSVSTWQVLHRWGLAWEQAGLWGCKAHWHCVGRQRRATAAGLQPLFSKLLTGRYLLN